MLLIMCYVIQVLDGITLKNLDVLKNKAGGTEGTLLNSLDQCCTPFGKRFAIITLTCVLLYSGFYLTDII